eukprot:763730-Hanusia_phi.AAC.8
MADETAHRVRFHCCTCLSSWPLTDISVKALGKQQHVDYEEIELTTVRDLTEHSSAENRHS